MPLKKAIERAERDRRQGKSASTQAGEFVREEIHRIREGRHGARSTKQAIAIGLSEARRAGVKLPPPKPGRSSEATRHKAERDLEKGAQGGEVTSRRRAKASLDALEREGGTVARQAHSAARQRTPAERSAAARKGAETKGAAGRSAAARKAAKTRAARRAGG